MTHTTSQIRLNHRIVGDSYTFQVRTDRTFRTFHRSSTFIYSQIPNVGNAKMDQTTPQHAA